MRFSFIDARKKPILSRQVKILIGAIFAIELVIMMLNISINTQVSSFEQIIEANLARKDKLDDTLKKLYKRERLIRKEAKQVTMMREKNRELRVKINKIFGHIGPKMTLKKVIWQSDGLVLEGFTEDEEAFKFSLDGELKKMYGVSKTVFFERVDGGFNFSSKNISKDRNAKLNKETTPSVDALDSKIMDINSLKSKEIKKKKNVK